MTAPRIVVLTRKQRVVLGELTRDGAGDPEIAARLDLSIYTVKTHMKRIMAAFKVTTRTAVVAELLNRRAVVRTVASRRGRDAEGERMSA